GEPSVYVYVLGLEDDARTLALNLRLVATDFENAVAGMNMQAQAAAENDRQIAALEQQMNGLVAATRAAAAAPLFEPSAVPGGYPGIPMGGGNASQPGFQPGPAIASQPGLPPELQRPGQVRNPADVQRELQMERAREVERAR